MANLQVKNVPPDVHRRLRRWAGRRGRTIRDLVLEAVRRELSHQEFLERLAGREPVDLGTPAAKLLDEARAERRGRLGV
jgi:plasmid stability protein